MAPTGPRELNGWASQALQYELDSMLEELRVLHQVTIPIKLKILKQGAAPLANLIKDRATGAGSPTPAAVSKAKDFFLDGLKDSVEQYENYLEQYHRTERNVGASIPIKLSSIEKEAIVSYLSWALFRSLDRYRTGHRSEELERVGEAMP